MDTFTKLLIFTFNFIFLLVSSFAQVESLDVSFGQDGIIRSYFYGNTATATSTAVQPDGKILIAGYFYEKIGSETSQDFVVLRLNSNGSLDYSFGEEGKVSTDFSVSTPGIMNDYATDMALQPDGKIIVVGYTYLNGYAVMARYNNDGSLDTNFGAGGKVQTAAADIEEIYKITISSVGLQSDGKIILGGRVYYLGDTSNPVNYDRFALFRYNPDGTLDTSFGTNGLSTVQFDWYNEDTDSYVNWHSGISAIAIQPDDKIVAVGSSTGSAHHETDCAIARFHPNGSLDNSFANNGKRVLRSSEDFYERANDVVILADGKILMVGNQIRLDVSAEPGSKKYPTVMAKFSENGNLVADFGYNGIVTDDLRGMGAVNQANAVRVQPDGKIVIAGSSQDRNSISKYDFALARYNSNGTSDVSFGDQGKAFLSFVGPYPANRGITPQDEAKSLSLQADGKVVVVGTGVVNGTQKIAVARYTSEGALDTEFSLDGKLAMSLNKVAAHPNTIAMQSDNKIIAGGYVPNSGYALIRYLPDGVIDSTYGAEGRSFIYMGVNSGVDKILVQPDGKTVALGNGRNTSIAGSKFAMVRFNEDGFRDTSFGDEGKVYSEFSAQYSYVSTGALQSDGKILIGGRTYIPSKGRSFLLQRYNTDGTSDLNFGEDGSVTTSFEEDNTCELLAMGVQSNGKIILAGKANDRFTLIRYLSNGDLDLDFGSEGIVQTELQGKSEISDIIIQPDGKILVGGHMRVSSPSTQSVFALARYNSNGTLDTSFGLNGKVTTELEFEDYTIYYNESKIYSLVLQDDGKIVAFGRLGTLDYLAVFVTVRYNIDGSIDTSFGNNGVVRTSSTDNFWIARRAILHPDNKLLVLGYFMDNETSGYALARYHLNGGTVGIEKVVNTNDPIKVYPNPSLGVFSVSSSEYSISKLKVINLLGQEVWEQTTSLVKGEVANVNLSSENKGIFFLHIETDSSRKSIKKIIVE